MSEVIDIDEYKTNVRLYAMIQNTLNAIFKTKFLSSLQRSAVLNLVKQKSDMHLSFYTEYERSLTYQLAAVIKSPKLTIVFCNDVDRMTKNVTTLATYFVHSEILFEELPLEEIKRVYKVLFSKHVLTTLLYVTPIEAVTDRFKTLLNYLVRTHKLAYMVVDETNHELLWVGDSPKHEFLELKALKEYCPGDIPWVLVTGPVTLKVVEKMRLTLDINTSSFVKYSAPAFIPNIFYDILMISDYKELFTAVLEYTEQCLENAVIKNYPTGTVRGLIICQDTEKLDEITNYLVGNKIRISSFCNRLSEIDLLDKKLQIMKGALDVISFTCSDRLDINFSNVSFIIHFGIPYSLLSYYETTSEVARVNSREITSRIFIQNSTLEFYKDVARDVYQLNSGFRETNKQCIKNFKKIFRISFEIIDYCKSKKCRHEIIADYFGDPKPLCINKCNNHISNDPAIINRQVLFTKVIELKDQLLKNVLSTKNPTKKSLKKLNDLCYITKRIKDFEMLECKDKDPMTGNKELITSRVSEILMLCEDLLEM